MNKLALIILDGFGIGKPNATNAIHVANTPFFDKLWENYPHTTLEASGEYVGLPPGQIGGSEVGHLTIGAGRVMYTDLARVNKAFEQPENPEFGILHNTNFATFIEQAQSYPAHLIGLLSPGGIHSHQDHLFTILRIMKSKGCQEPFIHVISDGRDTLPRSGVEFAKQLMDVIEELHFGKIVGVTGRFYAMDRDQNWDRSQQFLDLVIEGKAQKQASSLVEAFEENYKTDLTDELQDSTKILESYNGIKENEPLLFFNFRSDRMKQIITKLNEAYPINPFFTMTQYDKSYSYPVFFGKQHLTNTLSEVISKQGITQLKSAETDKIPHVTYFFNGGVETTFPKEIRAFVSSTKVTYDKSPEMRAKEIVDTVEENVEKNKDIKFAVVNFANADLVSHFGVFESSIKAVEFVDSQLERLCNFLTERNFICIITADHGNADEMVDAKTGQPRTAHTLNPVPFIIYDPNNYPVRQLAEDSGSQWDPGSGSGLTKEVRLDQSENKGLSRVAATVLEVMGIDIPPEYDQSLILK